MVVGSGVVVVVWVMVGWKGDVVGGVNGEVVYVRMVG